MGKGSHAVVKEYKYSLHVEFFHTQCGDNFVECCFVRDIPVHGQNVGYVVVLAK